MNRVLRNKLTKKVVLLALLITAFAYLRAPEHAQAQSTCIQECDKQYSNCIGGCTSNACRMFCVEDFAQCVDHCK